MLPTVPVCSSRLTCMDPMVGYSKSILLTFDAYLTQMQYLATKCNEAAKSRDAQKLAIEKRKCKEERILQVQKKKERNEAKAYKARETTY